MNRILALALAVALGSPGAAVAQDALRPEQPLVFQPAVQPPPFGDAPPRPRLVPDRRIAMWRENLFQWRERFFTPDRPPRGLAGWRTSWLDGVPATLEDGPPVGAVEGVILDDTGQATRVIVRDSTTGRALPVPRERVDVVENGRSVAVRMSRRDMLALSPLDPGAEPDEGVLALVPERR